MTDVSKLLSEASAKLQAEATKLRETISKKQAALEAELAPLRAQLAELDEAIERIEGKPAPARKDSAKRAPRGQNRTLLLEAVKAESGLTGSALAERTGIAGPTVYATLAKLVSDGQLKKAKTSDGVTYALKS